MNLVEWLTKEIADAEACATNSEVIVAALAPQMELFNATRDFTTATPAPIAWNTYAVRMAVDHRNSAKRDRLAVEMLTTALKLAQA